MSVSKENYDFENETTNAPTNEEKYTDDDSALTKSEAVNWLTVIMQIDEFDENQIRECLKDTAEKDLRDILIDIEARNHYLQKECEVHEFTLNEEETLQASLDAVKEDEEIFTQQSFTLSYPVKCYFARKKLEQTERELEAKKDSYEHELKILNFELESLNISLKDVEESKEKFNKNIRIGGRHPVTKKILLQKVKKYFEDSIRMKMALTHRYKIQVQGDVMERNKILNQITAQEKRFALLDTTEFQAAQFEHTKSCRQVAMYKKQLGELKLKFSPLLQNVTETKKALEREQNEMEQMKNAVAKLEHLKGVMFNEKARNDQKVVELKASMRKIKLDPRRHNLPEVIEYATVKRENASLMKTIKKWQKKVEVTQQEKLLYLNALSKKKHL